MSIYALLGVVGWNAFYFIAGERTLMDTAKDKIALLTATDGIDQSKVFRWQDAKGVWHYSDIKPSYEQDYNKFKTELEYLRKLPQNALPTGELPQAIEASSKTDILSMIPGIAQIQQGAQLVKEALNVQKMLDNHKEKLDQSTTSE
jgi:hypothetical protein